MNQFWTPKMILSDIKPRPVPHWFIQSFVHLLELYKIADKTLLSNVSKMENNIACLMQWWNRMAARAYHVDSSGRYPSYIVNKITGKTKQFLLSPWKIQNRLATDHGANWAKINIALTNECQRYSTGGSIWPIPLWHEASRGLSDSWSSCFIHKP